MGEGGWVKSPGHFHPPQGNCEGQHLLQSSSLGGPRRYQVCAALGLLPLLRQASFHRCWSLKNILSSKFHLSICFQKTQHEEVGARNGPRKQVTRQASGAGPLAARRVMRILSLVIGGHTAPTQSGGPIVTIFTRIRRVVPSKGSH